MQKKSRITVCHHLASLLMPNGDHWDRIIFAHQIRISIVFTHVFYLTYPYQPMGKMKNAAAYWPHIDP